MAERANAAPVAVPSAAGNDAGSISAGCEAAGERAPLFGGTADGVSEERTGGQAPWDHEPAPIREAGGFGGAGLGGGG